jgi:hypothetical protein
MRRASDHAAPYVGRQAFGDHYVHHSQRQCPARAGVDANVPVRLLRRAVRTGSITRILAPFLRALRMSGRARRFVGNRRSSYILITLPTATFETELLTHLQWRHGPGAGRIERGVHARGRIDQRRWILAELGGGAPTAWQNDRGLRRNFRIGRFVLARTSRAQCAPKLSAASTWRGASGSAGHLSSELHPRRTECRFGTVLVLALGAPTLPISGERRL